MKVRALALLLLAAPGCMLHVPVSTRPISAEVRAPPPDPKEGHRKSEAPDPTELQAAEEGEVNDTPGAPGPPGGAIDVPALPSQAKDPDSPIPAGSAPARPAVVVEDPAFDPFRAPGEVVVRWSPFHRPRILVVGPGYRRVTMPLYVGIGAMWGRPHPIEMVLIPNHGPSGTWTEEQVP